MEKHCPPIEEITALIDHQLGPEEKRRMMEHLISCPVCYELYSRTIETNETLSEQLFEEKYHQVMQFVKFPINFLKNQVLFTTVLNKSVKQSNKIAFSGKRFFYYATPLTAAVVFVVLFWSQLFNSGLPDSSANTAKLLVQHSQSDSLVQSFFDEELEGQSFMESGSQLNLVSMKVGMILIDLEIALRMEEPEVALEQLGRLNQQLVHFKNASALIETHQKILEQIKQEVPLDQFKEISHKTELYFQDHPSQAFFQFGQWIEGGRLAAITRNPEFFEKNPVSYFHKQLNPENTSKIVIELLTAIESVIKKNTLQDKEFEQLTNLFKELQRFILQ